MKEIHECLHNIGKDKGKRKGKGNAPISCKQREESAQIPAVFIFPSNSAEPTPFGGFLPEEDDEGGAKRKEKGKEREETRTICSWARVYSS